MNIVLFETLPQNCFIDCKDQRAEHILKILKLKQGDCFKMGLINKSEGISTITKITSDGILFDYKELCKPSLYPVTLLVAQVRPICMKRILREAVSLGCSNIILTGSDTGEKSYIQSSLYTSGEYKNYLLDGAMQSAHAGLSKIEFADKVEQAVKLAQGKNLIVLDNVKSSISLSQAKLEGSTVLAIGPERGWSDRERKIFSDNNYVSMLLGSRVLRTETACSAGLGVLLTALGYI